MLVSIKQGTTGYILAVYLQTADGSPKTGLAHNAAGLACAYRRPDGGNADGVAITLAAGTRGSYVDSGAAGTGGGFVEVGSTWPGLYELSLPSAATAAGAAEVNLLLHGASDMLACPVKISLPVNTAEDAVDEVEKVPRSATPITAGAASKHTRTGGTTDVDEVTIEPV